MIRALALSLALSFCASARAADPGGNVGGGSGSGGGGCWKDAEKLCPGIERGSGGVAACLKGKVEQVSDTCKAAHPEWASAQPPLPTGAAAPDPREDWRALCGDAFEKHCGTLALPRIPACMSALPPSARKTLSEPCRRQIKSVAPPAKKPKRDGRLKPVDAPAQRKP